MYAKLAELLNRPLSSYSAVDLLRYMQQRTAITYFALRDNEQAGPEQIAGVLEHQFTYNDESYQLPATFDWTANPSADIEWLILLHKFYFAPGLGDEFQRTKDSRFARKWIELTASWIDSVPLDFLSSDVTGRRVQNWIYAHRYFVTGTQPNRDPALSLKDADFYAKFLCSLHDQVNYLCDNLTPARNHRTIELYAIFMAATVFPEFVAAAGWLDFARRELEQNIQADLRSDGVHCEQSTDYHHLVVKNYLGVKRLASANGITFAPIFDELLQRALDFVMHVHRPDGMIPSLSDGDSRSFLDLLQQGHELYGNPAWLYVATAGRTGSAPVERSRTFPVGGYTILRSGWGEGSTKYADERYLIFDCGPLGEGNHGHLDLLNFEAAAYGKALVVDPGRCTYHEPDPTTDEINWRAYFRNTAAHNTVQVDGLEQTRYQFHKKKFKLRGPEPVWDLCTFVRHADHEIVHGFAGQCRI
ncbi:MAG: alginate lyase family protein [Caldilineaceae bacterium]